MRFVAWAFIAPAADLSTPTFVLVSHPRVGLLLAPQLGRHRKARQFNGPVQLCDRTHRSGPAADHRQRVPARCLFHGHSRRRSASPSPRPSARHLGGPFGTTTRTVLFLPQVIPLVAAGIAWSWMLAFDGVVNQLLTAIGLGSLARGWLGDFDFRASRRSA